LGLFQDDSLKRRDRHKKGRSELTQIGLGIA
jgi:hypothetical protein